MRFRSLGLVIATILVAAPTHAAERPAALFATGWVHNKYVVRPLVAQGIEVVACPADKMAALLAGGKYNVAVVTTMTDAQRQAIEQFLGRGGGVLVCNPEGSWNLKEWPAVNAWLAAQGARPRWEVLQDGDKKNVVRDVMGCELSWSDRVSPPVNQGVRGLLTLTAAGTTGWEPPMSFDFTPAWTVVARGAATLRGVREVRNDEQLQAWIPKQPLAGSPALMGLRQVGPGRLAVVGIRCHWLFTPPQNCPTTEAMLTAGADGKPSDWLRLVGNAVGWLAEPSLRAGLGGMKTPAAVLDPPVTPWEIPPQVAWTKPAAMQDMPQVQGLIGARTSLSSGTGGVAEYVRAAKAAKLQFIVFLEDSLKMDQARWDQLVRQCGEASDADFAAIPGLTYEDAQGNHLYAFADDVRFPKPHMLLPDHRLATNQRNRTQAYFDYVNELIQQHAITGFWNHGRNFLPPADYKLYNSFPIVSFEDGRPVDAALADFLYLQGIGGCQAALALEFMTSPEQVARRAADGWRVVSHRGLKDLRGRWYEGAFSFSGSGSQYITNGPRILVWESPNRLVGANGLWWRPDQWEYRVRLRVASEAGLKSVTLHDGDREVFRRWLPGGAQTFQQELVLANCQQRGLTLVVEDLRGRRAVSMSFWNRNLNMEEFFCSDRCNFLGSARLRTRNGGQYWTPIGFGANMGITPSKGRLDMSVCPAVSLTANSPTLPIDGAPAGFPTAHFYFGLEVPGELPTLFAYPQTYLVGPEIAIGHSDFRLGYDPAETGAKTTPLGHAYEQPQDGSGNSWGGWYRLIPTRKLEGYARTYAANWLTRGFRLGWHETRATLKDSCHLEPGKGLRVMFASGNWRLHTVGRRIDAAPGRFDRGTFFTLDDPGGLGRAHADGWADLLPLDARQDRRHRALLPARQIGVGPRRRNRLPRGLRRGRGRTFDGENRRLCRGLRRGHAGQDGLRPANHPRQAIGQLPAVAARRPGRSDRSPAAENRSAGLPHHLCGEPARQLVGMARRSAPPAAELPRPAHPRRPRLRRARPDRGRQRRIHRPSAGGRQPGGQAPGELARAGPVVRRGPQSDRRADHDPATLAGRLAVVPRRGDNHPAARQQQELDLRGEGESGVLTMLPIYP